MDTDGRPLDSGSQKHFERNEIVWKISVGEAKAIKYKKYYHVALFISEGQREGPTMTLSQFFYNDKRFANHRQK